MIAIIIIAIINNYLDDLTKTIYKIIVWFLKNNSYINEKYKIFLTQKLRRYYYCARSLMPHKAVIYSLILIDLIR